MTRHTEELRRRGLAQVAVRSQRCRQPVLHRHNRLVSKQLPSNWVRINVHSYLKGNQRLQNNLVVDRVAHFLARQDDGIADNHAISNHHPIAYEATLTQPQGPLVVAQTNDADAGLQAAFLVEQRLAGDDGGWVIGVAGHRHTLTIRLL